jgi:ribosomal protein S18 acetylase RimI-like enzyme
MEIRQARVTDLHGIRRCAEAAYSIYVPRMGKRPAPMVADFARLIGDGNVHVLSDGGTIAGFAVFYVRGNHVHLENVAVHPDFQKRGHGVQLIAYAEHFAAEAGMNAVELYTNVKMAENLSLYPRLGYKEIGRWQEDGFDRVFFRKTLTS